MWQAVSRHTCGKRKHTICAASDVSLEALLRTPPPPARAPAAAAAAPAPAQQRTHNLRANSVLPQLSHTDASALGSAAASRSCSRSSCSRTCQNAKTSVSTWRAAHQRVGLTRAENGSSALCRRHLHPCRALMAMHDQSASCRLNCVQCTQESQASF